MVWTERRCIQPQQPGDVVRRGMAARVVSKELLPTAGHLGLEWRLLLRQLQDGWHIGVTRHRPLVAVGLQAGKAVQLAGWSHFSSTKPPSRAVCTREQLVPLPSSDNRNLARHWVSQGTDPPANPGARMAALAQGGWHVQMVGRWMRNLGEPWMHRPTRRCGLLRACTDATVCRRPVVAPANTAWSGLFPPGHEVAETLCVGAVHQSPYRPQVEPPRRSV